MANKRANRSAMLALSLIFALVAAGGVFGVLYSFQKQTSYWVVNTEVDARTKITSSMLKEVKAREGSQPTAAMTAAYVDSHDVYAKYELEAGDIVTSSNAGDLQKITAGIPNNYSVSSFTVSATNAAVGMAKRGDYIDIYVVDSSNGQQSSSLVLQHVLVLDAVASLDEVSARNNGAGHSADSSTSTDSSSSSSTSSTSSSVSTIYQVGLSRQDTAKLALLSTKDLFVTLSPADGADADVPTAVKDADISSSTPTDSGARTDSTFSSGDEVDGQTESDSSSSSSTATASPSKSSSSGK